MPMIFRKVLSNVLYMMFDSGLKLLIVYFFLIIFTTRHIYPWTWVILRSVPPNRATLSFYRRHYYSKEGQAHLEKKWYKYSEIYSKISLLLRTIWSIFERKQYCLDAIISSQFLWEYAMPCTQCKKSPLSDCDPKANCGNTLLRFSIS